MGLRLCEGGCSVLNLRGSVLHTAFKGALGRHHDVAFAFSARLPAYGYGSLYNAALRGDWGHAAILGSEGAVCGVLRGRLLWLLLLCVVRTVPKDT